MTTGVLDWGQAGNYNAVNDRLVIRALAGPQFFGLVLAPTMAAGSGLAVNIGPWMAIVDAGDGTSAVVGNPSAGSINQTAGGASSRTDVLWADINVDATSQWSLSWLPSPVTGRTGVALGTATVPASAATAAAMTFAPAGIFGGSPFDTWHDMRPLSNSFLYPGTPFTPPQYRLAHDGFVDIIGFVRSPPTTGNYNSVQWAPALPAAYRPPGGSGASWSIRDVADGAASPKCNIDASGNIVFNYLPTSLAQTTMNVAGRWPAANCTTIVS